MINDMSLIFIDGITLKIDLSAIQSNEKGNGFSDFRTIVNSTSRENNGSLLDLFWRLKGCWFSIRLRFFSSSLGSIDSSGFGFGELRVKKEIMYTEYFEMY